MPLSTHVKLAAELAEPCQDPDFKLLQRKYGVGLTEVHLMGLALLFQRRVSQTQHLFLRSKIHQIASKQEVFKSADVDLLLLFVTARSR